MTITLLRKPFSKEEREIMVDAIMTGRYVEDWPELDAIATEIAEKLPDLLRRAGWPDNSDNRRKLIELVLVRWALPKTRKPPRTYRRLAAQR
ncbi:hypothetical protein QTH90_08540 [Variovorax sp. J2P1-59]|uniref:hypothetical protein n=1 Tax=Variovorax flavidus TaxID=3053501 RepID=UPI0025790876|nr:hypothetical protein [Variovorax sp. J2P1-59]MDM0074426.1 hypothetical protein [Variovorax sp. J2P1-59]